MTTTASESKIYDLEYQQRCLLKMKAILESSTEQANVLKGELEEKIQCTLGMHSIPLAGEHQDRMHPFITFDDKGHFNVSFLFDCPPQTFWKLFLRTEFGSSFLSLQKQVYSLISSQENLTRDN